MTRFRFGSPANFRNICKVYYCKTCVITKTVKSHTNLHFWREFQTESVPAAQFAELIFYTYKLNGQKSALCLGHIMCQFTNNGHKNILLRKMCMNFYNTL